MKTTEHQHTVYITRRKLTGIPERFKVCKGDNLIAIFFRLQDAIDYSISNLCLQEEIEFLNFKKINPKFADL